MSGEVDMTLAGSKRKERPGEGVRAQIEEVWGLIELKREDIMSSEEQIEAYEKQNKGILFAGMMEDPTWYPRENLATANSELQKLEETLKTLCKNMTSEDVSFLVDAFGKTLEKHLQEREKIEEDAESCRNKLTRCNACIMHLQTFRDKLMQLDTVSALEKYGFSTSVERMLKEQAKKDQDPYEGAKLVYQGGFDDVPKEIPLRFDTNVIGRWPRCINTPAIDSQKQSRMVDNSHANIINQDGKWILVDLRSINGTQVRIDGSDVRVQTHDLQDQDIITFGGACGVQFGESPPSTHTASGYVYRFELGDP